MTVQRAASAGMWSTIDVGVRQGVQFVVSVILARLLAPADFGIIALMTFFSSLAQVFIQGGLTTALIQRQETTHEEESTIFWLNLLGSTVFGAFLVLLAPLVSTFYQQPILQPLMWVAASQVFFSALGAVQTALLSRQLAFATLAKAGIMSAAASGVVGIAAAWFGAGLWALALQGTLAIASYSGALWVVSGWSPRLCFRPGSIVHLVKFGAWLSLSSVLEVIYSQGFSLLVGKLHGVRDLGLYNRAANTQFLPSNVLCSVIGRMVLPLFSRRSDDREAMRRGMGLAISTTMLLNVPIMVGLALLPDLVIGTLFGQKWLAAAPILSILAASGLLFPLHVINLQVLLAQGGSRTFFALEALKKLVGISCIAIGSLFGIEGLAWSQVVASTLAFLLNSSPTRRRLSYGPIAQLSDLKGIFLCSAIMGACVWFARGLLHFSAIINLSILVALGATAYCLCGFALRIPAFLEGLRIARIMLRNQPTPIVGESEVAP